jgi:hypothetical protein
MKHLFFVFIVFVLTISGLGQTADTVLINKQKLEFKYLQPGNSTYLIYFKKTADGPAERMTLVKINVEPTVVSGRKAFAVTQAWESGDEVMHRSYTLHAADDFSTLRQETWWKPAGFTAKFDFISKQVTFEGTIADAAKERIVRDFNDSFESYNLCWHSDLVIFPLFPYKNGRTFKVNFYDPGASKAVIADYKVTGSETLSGSRGDKIDCWIMEHKSTSPTGDAYSQRFWISKKTREVLKEEDQFNGGFRYKFKLGISGEK